MSRHQAIEIAKAELTKHGHTVSDYDITVDPENANTEYWVIWFEKKGPFPVPGGRHAVRINKVTGHAEFMPGE